MNYFHLNLTAKDNPLLRAELERVEKHQPIPPLDAVRYQVPAPPANASEEEWIAALNNAKSQLEHLRIRSVSLLLTGFEHVLKFRLDRTT